jgi:hypothetical protein
MALHHLAALVVQAELALVHMMAEAMVELVELVLAEVLIGTWLAAAAQEVMQEMAAMAALVARHMEIVALLGLAVAAEVAAEVPTRQTLAMATVAVAVVLGC